MNSGRACLTGAVVGRPNWVNASSGRYLLLRLQTGKDKPLEVRAYTDSAIEDVQKLHAGQLVDVIVAARSDYVWYAVGAKPAVRAPYNPDADPALAKRQTKRDWLANAKADRAARALEQAASGAQTGLGRARRA